MQKTEYLAEDAHPTQAQLTAIGYSFKTNYIMRVSGTSVKIFYNGSDRTFAVGDTEITVLQSSAGNVPFVQTLESNSGSVTQAYMATAQSSNPTNAECSLGSIYSHNGTKHVFSFASPSSLNDLYINANGKIYYNYLDHNGESRVYYIGASGFTDNENSAGQSYVRIAKPTVTNRTYNGSVQTGMVQGTGYTVTGGTAINAGTYTATATLRANYRWSDETSSAYSVKWTISAASVSGANFSLSQTTYTYSGSACKPTPIVVLNGRTLTLNTDYTVTYSNNTNVGTATITVTGIGNYFGTRIAYFTISRQSVSGATVSLSDTTYTGSACTPTPTVVVNGRTLTLNTDYTVTYSNNINVGTAIVTITGIGNYSGTKTANFAVLQQTISGASVTLSQSIYTYSGSACTPTPKVVVNGRTLTLNTDYTVTYSDNTNAGKATVTITGIGNYSGTKTANFAILQQTISGATVSLSQSSYTYSGSECKPTPTVKLGNRTLTLGTDYTVTYSNNTNASTATVAATVTVTGIGNYSGTKTANFTILQQTISGASVTLSQSSYTYSGSACKPTPTVKLGGRTLTLGTDYTVTYSNNTNASTATVTATATITGIGNYKDAITATFRINKANQTFSATSASHTVEALSGSARIAFSGTKSTAAHAFSSSDTRVATVSSQGVITAGNKVGTATVTVSNGGDSNYNARTITISVTTVLSNGCYIGDINGENTVYNTLKDAVAAVESNGTVKVKGSPIVDVTVTTNKNFTLSGDANAKITRGSGFAGSILNVTGGALLIENLTLDGGNVSGSSLVTSSGALTAKSGAKFINGNATDGGAIYSSGGTLTVEGDATFTGNTARGNGGAIYIADGVTASINGGVMSNNSAAVGDAIYIDNNTLNFNGTSATSGITDGVGIGGTGSVNVTDGLTHKVSVEFKSPENQKNDTKQYVTSSTNPKLTSQELKEYFRVVNSGFTFGTTVENALIVQNSTADVARVNGIVYKDLQSAIDAAAAIGGNVTVELIQYVNNTTPSLSTDTIEVASTLVIPNGANITFSSIVKNTTKDGTDYEWIAATKPTVLVRANNLTSELVRVSNGASLTLGEVVLDGGAVWTGGTPKVTDDGKGGAGTAVTNNSGVTAHAPIIVNGGTLNITDAIIRNNDNNYAKPGEGFGSQNYGGGVRNEGSGSLVMTGGSIENCYSREGGAIMNVNKPNSPAYVEGGAPSVTVSGGSITGNASQMKGAAVQTIYGGAKTTVSGSAKIENNNSLYDLGSLAVEEGGSLIISGGSVTAGSGNDNAVYVYNKYAAENYDKNSASKPFIEGSGAAQITITGNPTIGTVSGSSVVGGNVHLDNPCAVVNPDTGEPSSTVYSPVIKMDGYSGSSNINIDLDADRAYGDVVTANSDLKVTVIAQPDSKKYEVSYSYTKEVTAEGGKKLVNGGFAFDMAQTESGHININGICDPTVEQVVFTIEGREYRVAASNGVIDGVIDVSEVADVEISATVKPTFNDGTITTVTVNATIKAVLFDAATAKITAPDNTYYIDEAGERNPLSNGTLPNDIMIDASGFARFEVDGEIRTVHIGERGETPDSNGNVGGNFTDITRSSVTFIGEDGYEYALTVSGDIVTEWKAAQNGSVSFGGLSEGVDYVVVVRKTSETTGTHIRIPSKFVSIKDVTVLTESEAAAKTEFEEKYSAIKDGLIISGEGGIVAPTATVEEIQAIIDYYDSVISVISRVSELPAVAEKIEHLRASLDYAEAKAWRDNHSDIINKNISDVTVSDKGAINGAVADYESLSDGAKQYLTTEYTELANKYKAVAKQEVAVAASGAVGNETEIIKIADAYVAKIDETAVSSHVIAEIDELISRANAAIELRVEYDRLISKDGAISDISKIDEKLQDGLDEILSAADFNAAKELASGEVFIQYLRERAKSELSQAFTEINGSAAEGGELDSGNSAIDVATSLEEVNGVLSDCVKEMFEGLVNVKDSELTKSLVTAAEDALESAVISANEAVEVVVPSVTVSVLTDGIIEARSKEKTKAKSDLDGAVQAIIIELEREARAEADAVIVAAKSEIDGGYYTDYPLIITKAIAKAEIIKYFDETKRAAQDVGYSGLDSLITAKDAALEDIQASSGSDEVESAKNNGIIAIDRAQGVIVLENYLNEDDGEEVKSIVTGTDGAAVKIAAAVSKDAIDSIVEDAKRQIDAARFKAANAVNVPFDSITADDLQVFEDAKRAYEELSEGVKSALDKEAEGAGYLDFNDYIDDCVNKAMFESALAEAIETAKAFVRLHDGEKVHAMLEKQIDEINRVKYLPHADVNTRDGYLQEVMSELDEKLAAARESIAHSQKQQRTENQIAKDYEERVNSGMYSDAQIAELEELLNKAKQDISNTVTTDGDTLEVILQEIKDAFGEVSITAVSTGNIKPDKSPIDGGTGDYDDESADEVWGIVTNDSSMQGGIKLVIEKADADIMSDIKRAADSGKIKAADGSDLTESDLKASVRGKEIVSSLDIYLLKNEARITEFEGIYTVKVLLNAELRGNSGLVVVYYGDDGVEVFTTTVEDGKYLVFTTSHFSEFYILGEETIDLTWLIVLLSIALGVELIVIAYLLYKRFRRDDASEEAGETKDEAVAGTAFVPLAAIFVPSGAVAVCITLGVLVILAGVAIAVLTLLPQLKRSTNASNGRINEQTHEVPEDAEMPQTAIAEESVEKPQDDKELEQAKESESEQALSTKSKGGKKGGVQ